MTYFRPEGKRGPCRDGGLSQRWQGRSDGREPFTRPPRLEGARLDGGHHLVRNLHDRSTSFPTRSPCSPPVQDTRLGLGDVRADKEGVATPAFDHRHRFFPTCNGNIGHDNLGLRTPKRQRRRPANVRTPPVTTATVPSKRSAMVSPPILQVSRLKTMVCTQAIDGTIVRHDGCTQPSAVPGLLPHGRGAPCPRAAATQGRTLEAVRCRRWFGAGSTGHQDDPWPPSKRRLHEV